jgi:uncharacterized membrane protein YraQ (UPF0718 family)
VSSAGGLVVDQIQDFVLTFSSILWEALPFIVLGAIVAGILEELLPQQLITRVLPKYALPAVMMGGMLGLIFPMCECGIVVVMRRLLRKGLPLACCIAYLLAGPIVNVIVILSTYAAFKLHGYAWEMIAFRAGFGFLIAVITGMVVHFLDRRYGTAALVLPIALPPNKSLPLASGELDTTKPVSKKSIWQRLSNISATALHDFIDITVFLILGALLAASAKMMIPPDEIARFSEEQPLLAIPAMMLLAAILCLCSEADAFVAASFTGMHFAAKLAFLVYGPMFDIKLLLLYTRVFRARLIFTIVTCVTVQSLVYTLAVHAAGFNPKSTMLQIAAPPPTATQAAESQPTN